MTNQTVDARPPLPAIQIQPCDPLLYIGVPPPPDGCRYRDWGYEFRLPSESFDDIGFAIIQPSIGSQCHGIRG